MASDGWEVCAIPCNNADNPWHDCCWSIRDLRVESGTEVHVIPVAGHCARARALLLLFPHRATERVVATECAAATAAAASLAVAEDGPTPAAELGDDALRLMHHDLVEEQPFWFRTDTGGPVVQVQAGAEGMRRLVRGLAPAAAFLDMATERTAGPQSTKRRPRAPSAVLGAVAGDGRFVCMAGAYDHEAARIRRGDLDDDDLAAWTLGRARTCDREAIDALRERAAPAVSAMLGAAWLGRAPSGSRDSAAAAAEDEARCLEAAGRLAKRAGAAHADAVRGLVVAHLRGLLRRRAAAAVLADAWCRYAGAPWGPTARYLEDVRRGWRPRGGSALPEADTIRDVVLVAVSAGARGAYDAERAAVLRDGIRRLPGAAERVAARRMSLLDLSQARTGVHHKGDA